MRFLLHYQILLLLLLMSAGASAQSSMQKKEILRELNAVVPGKGRVIIYEDESISHVLGRPMAPPRTVYANADGTVRYYKMRGYRSSGFFR